MASPSATPTPTLTPSPSATPTPSHTPTPQAPRLAFASNRGGNYDIYAMHDDGSGLTRLTDHPAEDSRPSWSPDGTRIAFDSDRRGNYDIYVMGSDGSEVTLLTDHPSQDAYPVWSPDSSRIAFVSLRHESNPEACDPCNWEIYVMQADGTGLTRLTNDPAEDFGPTWSPDGTRLAFDSDRGGSYNIYVMNIDGSGVRQLTDDAAGSVSPAWSPDGNRIAFTTLRDEDQPYDCSPDCNWEIYTMEADGSGAVRLTNNPADDDHPAWSPDGARLAFVSWRDGNAEVYVMDAGGSGLTRLTDNPANDWDAVWAPY
jgi:TolB protein